ncbi:hypothetical protein CIHG_01182 [Coccidioides immitis H538.4]|uniref:Uncharacterized protein n=1 Tax=Coccidioides immitis H538.4 TaxID=396776 RepID=A0A0J8RHC8_COCIT|nr:hypothetical protein CIHG_01182 [Coccidioides immitis H538.4]
MGRRSGLHIGRGEEKDEEEELELEFGGVTGGSSKKAMDWAVSDAAGSGPREGRQVTVRGGDLESRPVDKCRTQAANHDAAHRQPDCGFWGTGKMGEKLGDAGECSDVSPAWELRQATLVDSGTTTTTRMRLAALGLACAPGTVSRPPYINISFERCCCCCCLSLLGKPHLPPSVTALPALPPVCGFHGRRLHLASLLQLARAPSPELPVAVIKAKERKNVIETTPSPPALR